ncbi:ATP-dependent DNA helicase MER3 [Friedmanniomyces endolithicus]|nr:ATP-dependent DNA helicase MER3 [Friedmanniomyces endolithicus]
MPLVNRPPYYISNAVFLSEILKLATSLSLALYDIATDPHTLEDLTVTGLFTKLGQVVFTSDSWKMALPAILYTLQTTLQYIGVSNLDDATFQVTSQLEMLVTAVLSVTMLGRSLSMRKWVATIILMVGIAIVQVPTFSNADTTVLSTKDLQGGVAFHSPRTIWDLESLGNAAAGQLSKRYATYEGIEVDDAANAPPEVNTRIGLVAVVLACSLSGVASAYSEKALKDAKPEVPSASAWVRNVQMSFYSIWPALFIGVFFTGGKHIAKTGFFAGYNSVVWLAIMFQALGGVVGALVVNNVDNFTENLNSPRAYRSFSASWPARQFSTSRSHLHGVFSQLMQAQFLLGTSVVFFATYLCNTAPEDEALPPPINLTAEKSGEQSYFDLESVTVAAMDERIFQQLDVLERGARFNSRPAHDGYNISSAEYSAYDGHGPEYRTHNANTTLQRYHRDHDDDQPAEAGFIDPLLPNQPHIRHATGTSGHARLSFMPDEAPLGSHARPRAFDISRFAFDAGHTDLSSSSGPEQAWPSSPAFRASQQRPAIYSLGRGNQRSGHRPAQEQFEPQTAYQPVSVEQLEHEEQRMEESSRQQPEAYFHSSHAPRDSISRPKKAIQGPPVVQGISLVSTHELPDRFRSIFSFPLFNAVQSKCFETIYKSNDNLVLSAPTGSGKTAVLELAICRLISGFASGSYKIVYQAPTKSLCSERQRDWQRKLGPLDIQCAELTGDTDISQLRSVQNATIIITTPEKWDSVTRKWKDHQKLMQMVKLFLIDEVHILKEDRGATLEAVVSRMKSVGSNVRFVALSATVPNSQDIATWLGKDPMNQHVPAVREHFGEEFRPVRLQKHVAGYQGNSNDFAFEKMLNAKLPEVITKWSRRKPIMVFCFTRSSCVDTAKLLATWWATKGPKDRFWSAPRQQIVVGEKDLRETLSSGVAFHHAGLQVQDRLAVEKGYLEGEISVICCTSTLAVGVNLPCHMAIIKNTITYTGGPTGSVKEYSDLEIMQMLGRAGRPQFDDSAVAVIMTRLARVPHYEKMITGQEILESCLHRNLIDHLNADIGLGTITSAASAKKWLSGTFLHVRLKENPDHYKLQGDSYGQNLEECLDSICRNGIAALEESDLVQSTPKLHCTEFGDSMARYYLQFETMKVILALPPKAKLSEILSAVAQAAEFRDVRFRGGEKSTYKELNKNASIKFPIPVNLDQPAHKVSLVIQAVLGAIDFPSEDYKQRLEFGVAKATIFQQAQRFVRCIVDCQLFLDDAVSTRNALMLARSLGAQVWDDSPLHMKQLDGVGLVSVRKLAVAGIKSIEDIETTEAHRLEGFLSRNPPYGEQLQKKAKAFPKLRISMKTMGEPSINKGQHVTVNVKAEIGFLNETVPTMFQGRQVYVCLLAETSDGHKVHFARISAKKLDAGQEVMFSANLTNAGQTVRAYIMCDEIAGSARHAMLKPDIPAIAFPPPKTAEEANKQRSQVVHAPNIAKRRASALRSGAEVESVSDEFGDAGLDDADLTFAETGGFVDIDDLDNCAKQKKQRTTHSTQVNVDWEPKQLADGKWACNHTCKDKTVCKHMCCRDGLDKKPKPPKQKEIKKQAAEPGSDPKQTQLSMVTSKRVALTTPATGATQKTQVQAARGNTDMREVQDLNRLHNSVRSSTARLPVLGKGKATDKSNQSGQPRFFDGHNSMQYPISSDFGMDAGEAGDSDYESEDFRPQSAPRMSPSRDSAGFLDVEMDMLDTGPGTDAEGQLPADGPGDGHIDFPSYSAKSIFAEPEQWDVDDNDMDDLQLALAVPQTRVSNSDGVLPVAKTSESKHLFVGYSTDSAEQSAFDAVPGTKQAETRPLRAPPAQLRPEFQRPAQPFLDNSFLAGAADGQEANGEASSAESPDELAKWFSQEFGNELFNYTG